MVQDPDPETLVEWGSYRERLYTWLNADAQFKKYKKHFFERTDIDRVALVKWAVEEDGDRDGIFWLLNDLTETEKQAAFPYILRVAMWYHYALQGPAIDFVLTFSNAWLVANLEAIAEPYMHSEHEDVGTLFYIYDKIGFRAGIQQLLDRAAEGSIQVAQQIRVQYQQKLNDGANKQI